MSDVSSSLDSPTSGHKEKKIFYEEQVTKLAMNSMRYAYLEPSPSQNKVQIWFALYQNANIITVCSYI